MHMGGAPGNLAAEFIRLKKEGKGINLLVNNDFHNFSQCTGSLLLKCELTTLVKRMIVFSSFSLHGLSGPACRPVKDSSRNSEGPRTYSSAEVLIQLCREAQVFLDPMLCSH